MDRLTILACLFMFSIALFVYAFGAFTFGWNLSTKFKLYVRYQNNNALYLKYLFLSFLLIIYPVYTIIYQLPRNGEEFLFMFPVYLLLFKLINRISITYNKRPVLISTRWDYDSEKRNFLDILLTGLAFLSTVFISIWIHFYI